MLSYQPLNASGCPTKFENYFPDIDKLSLVSVDVICIAMAGQNSLQHDTLTADAATARCKIPHSYTPQSRHSTADVTHLNL
ncbi:unnamed protein product, partial [Mesorhabditis spiculigera]